MCIQTNTIYYILTGICTVYISLASLIIHVQVVICLSIRPLREGLVVKLVYENKTLIHSVWMILETR